MIDKDLYVISGSNGFIRDRRVNIRLWHDDLTLRKNLFNAELSGIFLEGMPYKIKLIPQSIHFKNLQQAFPSYEKSEAEKHSENNNFFQYILKAIKANAKELNLPQNINEAIEEYIKANAFLKIDNSSRSENNFLGRTNNSVSFDAPYAAIEPKKYLRTEADNISLLSRHLKIFINSHNLCCSYITKNLDEITKILGDVIVSSSIDVINNPSNYNEMHSPLNVKFFGIDTVRANTKGKGLLRFKHAKDEAKYFDINSTVAQSAEKSIREGMGYDKAKKDRVQFLFINKKNIEHFENLKTPGLVLGDREDILGEVLEENKNENALGNKEKSKSGLLIISQQRFDLKKFVPALINTNVTLNFLFEGFPKYSLQRLDREEKYGARELVYVYASVKPSVKHSYKKNGFLKNKTGTNLTLELSEAFAFQSEKIAKEFIDKGCELLDYEFSFVKARIEVVNITGVKPVEDKEFMNYLTQWEKESLTKSISNVQGSLDNIEHGADKEIMSNNIKKKNKI